MKLILPIAAGVLLAVIVGAAVRNARQRRARRVSELNQHPERLEQMLDPTDDA